MISVAICTHNPRPHYLERVLAGIRGQTLGLDAFELVLIDNASTTPLGSSLLDWHPNGRVILESNLGLTPARLRAIRETQGDVILFVDDDNVLEPDFLAQALRIGSEYPRMGTWGGQVFAEFETPPPEHLGPWLEMLAIREFDRDIWSNQPMTAPYPCGAGMCVRRVVAEQYAAELQHNPTRMGMDRRGAQLFSSGDTDLAITGCEMGYGAGRFTGLKLTHLIPKERLTQEYFVRLMEADRFSWQVLLAMRGKWSPPAKRSPLSYLIAFLEKFSQSRYEKTLDPRVRELLEAERRGKERAAEFILQNAIARAPR